MTKNQLLPDELKALVFVRDNPGQPRRREQGRNWWIYELDFVSADLQDGQLVFHITPEGEDFLNTMEKKS